MAEFYRKKRKVCQMCAGKDVDYKNIEVIIYQNNIKYTTNFIKKIKKY